jgi:ABC-type microcin C transport system duplicated ATPase subunit YejF
MAQEIRKIRGGEIGMIFQEPMSSLTPYTRPARISAKQYLHHLLPKTVGDQMGLTISRKRAT